MSEQELLSLAFLLQSLGFVALILVARVHREKLNQQLCDAKKELTRAKDLVEITTYRLNKIKEINGELIVALKDNGELIRDLRTDTEFQRNRVITRILNNQKLIEQMEKGGMV